MAGISIWAYLTIQADSIALENYGSDACDTPLPEEYLNIQHEME